MTIAQNVAKTYGKIKMIILLDTEIEAENISSINTSEVTFSSLLKPRQINDLSLSLNIPVSMKGEEVASLMFSSGSTGLPKMVMRTHRNQLAQVLQLSHSEGSYCGPLDIVTCFTPLCHMGGYMTLGKNLFECSKVLMFPIFEVKLFFEYVQKYKVTQTFMAPSYLGLLISSPLLERYDLSSLNMLLTGGAALPGNVAESLRTGLKSVQIIEMYGSTESGGTAMRPTNFVGTVSVGPLLPGVSVKIRDPSKGEDLGPNQVGEILVKGDQISPGYYGNPEATKAAFSEDGFYKTGDAAYFDEKGLLYIVDRFKELIKVSSFQVAPKELESVLEEHQSVAEVAVIGIPDETYGQIPKAYVVLKPGHEGQVSDTDLMTHVKGLVADWKQLRGGVQFLEIMPKMGIGKIDRQALKRLTPKY
jgi:acyl-CoA synthetase (AMP-forming)/AMP-acid ligase II